jgi:putative flippase GtrA
MPRCPGRRSFRYACGMLLAERVTAQIAMGVAVAVVCAFGLWRDRWLFQNTRKGRMLARWYGEIGGLRALRAFLVVGILFGILLAADVIRPIHWGAVGP